MKTLKRLLALVAILPPGFAAAVTPAVPDGLYRSDAGVEYTGIALAGRTVLSTRPADPAPEVLTFTPDCRVESALLGAGTWGVGAGGVQGVGREGGPEGTSMIFEGPDSPIIRGFPAQILPGLEGLCRWQ